jgi:hypothetical protein
MKTLTTAMLVVTLLAPLPLCGQENPTPGASGANVVAALRAAKKLGRDRVVVTIMCDSGMKYLSTDLYSAS